MSKKYTVVVTDWGSPQEYIIESARMTLRGVRALLRNWGGISHPDIDVKVRELEKEGFVHARARKFPDVPYSFDIEAIRENETVGSNCQYQVQINGNFNREVALDWVIVRETGLRLLLKRVCGASQTQCDKFIDKFDKISVNSALSFDGVDGQEDLAYTLVALKKT